MSERNTVTINGRTARVRVGEDIDSRWMGVAHVLGEVASWAIRQHPYHEPPMLVHVLRNLKIGLLSDPQVDDEGFAILTPAGLEAKLRTYLWPIEDFLAWNRPRSGDRNGAQYVFHTRDSKPRREDDIVDLDALVRNVVLSVFRELDREHEIDFPAAPGA